MPLTAGDNYGTFAGTVRQGDQVIRTLEAIVADLLDVRWRADREEWERVIGQLDLAMSRVGELSGVLVLAKRAAVGYRSLTWLNGRRV